MTSVLIKVSCVNGNGTQHMIYADHKDAFAKDETVFIMGCLLRDGESLPLNVNSDRLTVFGMLKKKTWCIEYGNDG